MLTSLAAVPAVSVAQTRKPNFVFLFADDMGWGDVGFNGRREWSTPNLDKLGREGTIFDRWYTACPLCAPSRAALMTGKYNIHNGVRNNSMDLPATEVTVAEALKAQGYRTALFGKWHKGRMADGGFIHPLDQGFDETFGYLDALHAWEHFPKKLWRGREEQPVKGYSCDLLADEAVRFIGENRNNPFLLYVPFIEPHFLIEAPEEDVARFKGKFSEKDPSKPFNANYAAMITRLDRAIGRIVAAIDQAGLGRDTVIVFTSDNGATFEKGNEGASNFHDSNRPFRGQKRSLEEGGIREPGIVRWTGHVPAGKRSTVPMHNIDILPTFVAAAGSRPDPAWKVDGANMLDVWLGRSNGPERTLFWDFRIEGVDMAAAMRGDHKLLVVGGNRSLYNVRTDPGERRTLGPEMPDLFKQLDGELKAWLATEVKR